MPDDGREVRVVPDWRPPDLIANDNGQLLPTTSNVLTWLRGVAGYRGLLGYDEMARVAVLLQPFPARPWDKPQPYSEPERLTDIHVIAIQESLQRHGFTRIAKQVVCDAVELRATECRFHPVRDWLDGLTWDGERRLSGWLNAYLGAEHSPYSQMVGVMMLVGMVARIFKPGCKLDHMPVLIGSQGAGKSTICRVLVGPRYFSDSLPDLQNGGRDVSQHIRGKWLIEISELAAISKAEAALLKAFISRVEEVYRPSYGRHEVCEPRQCMFIGTTNKAAFLRDETGGRRFWPVEVGAIDINALARDREQLFAEAVAMFHGGYHWWPDKDFEAEHIRPRQESRYDVDAWEELIAPYLSERRFVKITEVAVEALHLERARIGTSEQRRIASIMERLGWRRGARTAKERRWEKNDG